MLATEPGSELVQVQAVVGDPGGQEVEAGEPARAVTVARTDPRVIVMEETNARFVESLPEPVDFISIDASFISLKVLLPVVV